MSQNFNPFEHHHPHGHDHEHDHDAGLDEAFDPAQRSLADALRVSFVILKWLMVVLVVVYLLSGMFTVGSDKVAMRLRFGRIVTVNESTGQKVLDEGIHFAWPFPIETNVKIPKSQQQIELDSEFWYQVTDKNKASAGKEGPLNPELDGSLLTGDANIAHARWSVTYQITDPVAFITNIGDPTSEQTMLDAAKRVVRRCSEQGIVYAVAQLTADRLQRGLDTTGLDIAKKRIQAALDGLSSGIKVNTVANNRTVFPVSVQPDFQAVIDAENEKAQRIEKAEQQRATILGETAGQAYEPLLSLIESLELASQSGDTQRVADVDAKLDKVFSTLTIDTPRGPVAVGGKVAEAINAAKTYRTEVVADVRGRSDYFNSLLPEYEKNPSIVENRLWLDAFGKILSQRDIEIIVVPPNGLLDVYLNRNPKFQKEQEEKARQKKK